MFDSLRPSRLWPARLLCQRGGSPGKNTGMFSLWVYMCMYIFSHTFYCCYKRLPLHWAFALLWSFPFFFLSSSTFFFSFFIVLIFNFLKPIIFFLHLFLCLPFLLFFSPCSSSLMYINLHLPLFNFAYLFFLFFLFFPLNTLVSFVFKVPCGTLLIFVFQFVLWLVLFLTGKYNFWFPLFAGSIYCTLF